jgi:CDP-glucose 4,6-dehydratase
VELGPCALEDLGVTPGFWTDRNVFVTGDTGFKGAWLSLWLGDLGARVTGYALDPLASPNLYNEAGQANAYSSIRGDVRDLARLSDALRRTGPEVVFHLAAQALVRESYRDAVATFDTNVMGTVNVLEACRKLTTVKAIVVITTDKCYEEAPLGAAHRESDPLGGHDPYAASKACAEIVTGAYRRSFFSDTAGARVASARAGNVIGGGDWAADRLMPDLMRAFGQGRVAEIRHPEATRPWQHVLDPLRGYLELAERLCREGSGYAEAWNFGPEPRGSIPVREVVTRAAALWGKGAQWTTTGDGRLREAPALALDSSKAKERLGWSCRFGVDEALEWTVDWYRQWMDGKDARSLTLDQIGRYMERLTG